MLRDFVKGLPTATARVFLGYNWMWHVVAIALTSVLVMSGFDWWYFEHTRNSLLQSLALPAAIIGFFVPILLSVGMYAFGEKRHNHKMRSAGAAVGQASIIGWLVSSAYKAFTGRQQPEFLTHTSNIDNSHTFHFGFLQHGVFWGWPSSHTAVAFAGMVTLALLYKNNKLLGILALAYAVYIGLGVSVSIHWFSDFVAGAILGSVIGAVVAHTFASH